MKPDQPAQYKPRNAGRTAVSARARLRHPNLYDVEIVVRDVSTRGFMAECPEAVGIGGYVTLDVPGIGPVRAQVRWQLGHRMGGMFLDPISLARCEWIAVKADHAEEAAEA